MTRAPLGSGFPSSLPRAKMGKGTTWTGTKYILGILLRPFQLPPIRWSYGSSAFLSDLRPRLYGTLPNSWVRLSKEDRQKAHPGSSTASCGQAQPEQACSAIYRGWISVERRSEEFHVLESCCVWYVPLVREGFMYLWNFG